MSEVYTGNASFKDGYGYLAWYAGLPVEEAKQLYDSILSLQAAGHVAKRAEKMLKVDVWYSSQAEQEAAAKWPGQRDKFLEEIRDFMQVVQAYQLPLRVGEWVDGLYAYVYLGNDQKGVIVPQPEQYLEYTPEKDYSDMTPAQVRAQLSVPGSPTQMAIVPADVEGSMTQNGVLEQKQFYEEKIEKLSKDMEDVKNARSGELKELQDKIWAMENELKERKETMMQQLEEKMAEMEQVKERLENQIYMLDSQIYAIRCFAGEVVKFTQIRAGSKAADTEPVVIHQKLHFLDEDLGRLASLYEIQWGELDLFEEFLKHSPLALETFAPNKRCISLVRLSRDGTQIGMDSERPHQNLLQKYEYYHGCTIGIIIRNGDNLYLGWTDEKRVHIEEDLLVGRVVTDVQPEEQDYTSEWERKRQEKKEKEDRRKLMDGIISRSFVYNILQGIVEHTQILPLPAGVTLGKQSEYVVYSVADKWISDNRFGSFNELIERSNARITKGDMVLTVQRLRPEQERVYRVSWTSHRENVRGRGWANRTHDVTAADCTIYPVNLVEYDEPVSMTRYKLSEKDEEFLYSVETKDVKNLVEGTVLGEEYIVRDQHVFVSLEKDYSDAGARANFEVYKNEYINLTYLDSVVLEWVITNKALGGWYVGGKDVNYAYAIRYLKKAIEFVRQREAAEKAFLDEIDPKVCQKDEWQVRLTEWKLAAGVREITPYQAKRFVKHLAQSKATGS